MPSEKVAGKNKMRKKILSVAGLSMVLLISLKKIALGAWDPYETSGFGLPGASIYEIITNILDWLLTIVGIAGVIGFIISGLMYLTSAGNDDKIKKAKGAMTAAITGVIVAVCGVVVLLAVDRMLNADYLF